jgi:hypothetical protein
VDICLAIAHRSKTAENACATNASRLDTSNPNAPTKLLTLDFFHHSSISPFLWISYDTLRSQKLGKEIEVTRPLHVLMSRFNHLGSQKSGVQELILIRSHDKIVHSMLCCISSLDYHRVL